MWLTLRFQDGLDELIHMDGVRSSGIVNINTTSAILFVVIASCFLVMLYKLMSYWFIEVLVVLFCIGGVEVGLLYFDAQFLFINVPAIFTSSFF
jgi:hypothetical protein